MHLIRIIRETGDVVYRQPNAAVALDNDDIIGAAYDPSVSQLVFTISWLKAPTSAFTFKTLLRHYAKQALTPRSLNVKLGPRCNYHKGRTAVRHYTNQPTRPL